MQEENKNENFNTNTEQPVQPPTSSLNSNEIPPQPQSDRGGRKNKLLIIILVIVVLLLIGAVVYLLFFRESDEASETTANTETQQSIPEDSDVAEVKEFNGFYVSGQENKVYIIEPDYDVSTFSFESDLSIAGGGGIQRNDSIQFAEDTKAFLYAPEGPGTPIDATNKIVINNGTNEREIEFNNEVVIDWLLTRDGSVIYVVAASQDKAGSTKEVAKNVYRIDTSSFVRDDVGALNYYSSIAVRMTELDSGEIVLYEDSNGEGALFALKYEIYPTFSSSSAGTINQPCITVFCNLEFVDYTSPNGAFLLWEESDASQSIRTFQYHLQNSNNEESEMIISLDSGTDQPNPAYWSGDSRYIAYGIGQFGQDDIERKDKINVYDTQTKLELTVFENPTVSPLNSEYEDFRYNLVTLIGWYPNNKHVVIRNKGIIKLVNVETKEVTDIDISLEAQDFIMSQGSY